MSLSLVSLVDFSINQKIELKVTGRGQASNRKDLTNPDSSLGA